MACNQITQCKSIHISIRTARCLNRRYGAYLMQNSRYLLPGTLFFLKKKEKSLYRHQQMYTFVSKNANFYTEKHVTI